MLPPSVCVCVCVHIPEDACVALGHAQRHTLERPVGAELVALVAKVELVDGMRRVHGAKVEIASQLRHSHAAKHTALFLTPRIHLEPLAHALIACVRKLRIDFAHTFTCVAAVS